MEYFNSDYCSGIVFSLLHLWLYHIPNRFEYTKTFDLEYERLKNLSFHIIGMKWIIAILILATVLIAGCTDIGNILTTEELCKNSGGTVKTQLCCNSVNDFPDTCLIGACGCSPNDSHEVKVCDCGEGKCWNKNTNNCTTT